MKYQILYVENCSQKVKSFKSKEAAKKFLKSIVSQDINTQNNVKWVSGIVIGEYYEANLDYEEKKLLKILE
jgi:viroplasmin and RNaseH domain-containing protein